MRLSFGPVLLLAALGCSPVRTPDEGGTDAGSTCQARICEPGKTCGLVDDGCGGVLSCSQCTSPQTCGGGGVENVCGEPGHCTPETNQAFCARAGADCGSVIAADNCGTSRTASCGSCTTGTCSAHRCTIPAGRAPGSACTQAAQCAGGTAARCTTDLQGGYCLIVGCTVGGTDCPASSMCLRLNDTTNACVAGPCSTTSPCARASEGYVCDNDHSCWWHPTPTCIPDAAESLCAREGRVCGALTTQDNCGQTRSIASCGTCGSGTCDASGLCACLPEADAAFCARLGKSCGRAEGLDSCGSNRVVDCGTCGTGGIGGRVVKAAAGGMHTCVLTRLGGVKCWGDNVFGALGMDSRANESREPVDVVGLTSGVLSVESGMRFSCALTEAGGVKCWGDNGSGELGDGTTLQRWAPVDVTGLASGVVAIATGHEHACALLSAGTLECWGKGYSGQLGNGATTSSSTPVTVTGLTGVTAVAAGDNFTCAVVAGGKPLCWGVGPLGSPFSHSRSTPGVVDQLTSGVTAITAGLQHVCVVVGGGVKCWGTNTSGQLGDGSTTSSDLAVAVSRVSGVVAVAAGGVSTCALLADRTVKCWGSGSAFPHAVPGMVGIASLSAGDQHACGVTVTGALRCFGKNLDAQLGDGSTQDRSDALEAFGLTSGDGVATLSAGTGHTCVSTTNGSTKCWGSNYGTGALGTGDNTDRDWPVPTLLAEPVSRVEVGDTNSCAISLGRLFCWGTDLSGQLGDGLGGTRVEPFEMPGISGVTAVDVGYGRHICAIVAGGAVECIGDNGEGQIGDGLYGGVNRSPTAVVGLPPATALALGKDFSCALTSGGGVKCWGNNRNGQLGDGTATSRPTPVDVSGLTSGVKAIAAGVAHACALTTAGALKCWGDNSWRALGTGSSANQSPTPAPVVGLASGVLAMSLGEAHSCAVVTGGTVKCWGGNAQGQLGDGTTTNRPTAYAVSNVSGAIALSAGGTHTCAVTSSGAVWCWGNNLSGRLGNRGTYSTLPVQVLGM